MALKSFPHFVKQQKDLIIPLVIFLTPLIWSLGYLLLKISPLGLCVELGSGKIPYNAQERFIKQVIEKTLKKDYQWLVAVSNEKTVKELISLRSEIDKNYTIIGYREDYNDSGAGYHFYIRFNDNRKEIYLVLSGDWPTCLDFNVTEQEILEHIELNHAAKWRY